MAEEKKDGGKKAKRKHLLEIRSRQAHDGSIVHHHTYMRDKNDPRSIEPEREAMATSQNPEEAGQHTAEQFGMNQMGDGGDAGGGEQPGGEGGAEAEGGMPAE